MERVIIFDTTLRDGEQSPGASMTSREKLEVARALSRLGVDVIEAGFPAASPDDHQAVRAVARDVGNDTDHRERPPVICGLARARRADLESAADAIRDAARPRVHTFLATSPIHREHKLGLCRAEVLERVRETVARARELCEDVEFSAEDACRTEPGFLCEVFAAALAAGASTLNVPDTVGYTTPAEMDRRVRELFEGVPGLADVTLSVHCHDDLGMATANTLAAIAAGARQVEVTINGIGERAGNTALEEVVMALHTRARFFELDTGIDTTRLHPTSRLVSQRTGMVVQANKAVVGANAFAHEAGIHQDGMLKHGRTYEIMTPESVGVPESRLVLGKHSGRHGLRARLEQLGHALDGAELDEVFARFKALADRRKAVTDADLLALVCARAGDEGAGYRLEDLEVTSRLAGEPRATVRLVGAGGTRHEETRAGHGPVHACFEAIDVIVGCTPRLLEYRVHGVTEGIDALGEVSLRVARERGDSVGSHPQHETATPRVFHGYGADTDIVVASAQAYLGALNRMLTNDAPGAGRSR